MFLPRFFSCLQLLPGGTEASKYLLWWYLEDQIKVSQPTLSLGQACLKYQGEGF